MVCLRVARTSLEAIIHHVPYWEICWSKIVVTLHTYYSLLTRLDAVMFTGTARNTTVESDLIE